MTHHPIRPFSLIGWFCLLSDGLTGLALILAPAFTLQKMGVQHIPDDPIYIQYIGVFVLCAGLTYAVPHFFSDPTQRLTAWHTTFLITILLRTCIALFVTSAIIRGHLDHGWISVPVYDAILVIIQAVILKKFGLRKP